ncbi:MAG: autotransporter-associated beta strand repeat-containing protein [Planctomycetota bacterium]
MNKLVALNKRCALLFLIALVQSWYIHAGNSTFTGPGNFSNAALWGGTLPGANQNLRINGTCTFDNAASNLAYGTLSVGNGAIGTLNWPVGGTNTLNVTAVSSTTAGSAIDMTNGGTLQIRTSWTTTSQTFTPGTGTIVWNVTGAASTLPATIGAYNNLTVLCTGRVASLGMATTVNGNLLISAGTLDVTAANLALTVKGNFTNNATFTQRTGTVTLSGTAAQAIGGTTATAFNNLTLGNTTAPVSGNTNFSVGGTLTANAGAVLTPAAAVVVSGAGTLTGSGSVQVTSLVAAPDLATQYTITTKTLTNLTVDFSGAGSQQVDALSTYRNLKISGTGTKTAAGAVTASGLLTVSSTFSLANFAVTVGSLTGSGTVDNSVAGTPTLTVGSAASSTFSGVIQNTSGTVALTKTGAGTLTLSGANAYSGATTISTGTLQVANVSAIPSGAGKGDVTVNGTLDLNGNSIGVNGLLGSGTVDNSVAGTPTLTVGNNNVTSTFSGVIKNTSGTVALAKTGTGTLTLSGANLYTGATAVSAGTLLVNGSLAAGAGATTVSGSATLGGTGTVRAVTVASGGIVSPGSAPGVVGTLSATSADFSAGGILLLDVPSTASYDVLNLSGALTVGGTSVLKLASVPAAAGGPITVASYGSLSGANFDFIDNASTTMGVSAAYGGAALTLTFAAPVIAIEWDPSTRDSSGLFPGATATAAWTLNGIALGAVHRTDTASGGPPTDTQDPLTFVVVNKGTVNELFTVTCAAATVPAGWTIGASAGYNVFETGANNDNSYTYNSLNAGGFQITPAKIRTLATQNFCLRYKAPISTNTVATKSIAVTVTATAP